VAGPAAFIVAWAVLGTTAPGYDPVRDPISRLAAATMPTRWAMTGGMLALAAGLGAFARGSAPRAGPVARAAFLAAATTAAVAATPLDTGLGGAPHAVAAGSAYVALAGIPAAAARERRAAGDRAGARRARVVAVATIVPLCVSALGAGPTGLAQRAGLTVGHLWVMAAAGRSLVPARPAGDGDAVQAASCSHSSTAVPASNGSQNGSDDR
jgi:hypothetical protein